ncbi:MAG TPA: anthranilate phosphoribosyltransferase [Dehalococcoidia bacterium]|nr:anthranilate phosphoribosyltransferase [Dehalococcoidia bacterium]
MIKEAISILTSGKSLSMEQSANVMDEIMNNEATPAQFGAFVTALRCKGETVEEIAGLVKTMRARSLKVAASETVVDTCGTGGDNAATFNISTTAAFVVAGAGLKVAKHGNRAMSSRCGSADVLEALGVKIDLSDSEVQQCIDETGIAFFFAQVFHPAMKYAAAPRREIGIRTVFNILGPLTNPAGAKHQLIGVSDSALTEKLAHVLRIMGSKHALIVHGRDGLDELTITGSTRICELQDGRTKSYDIVPEDAGLTKASSDTLKGGSVQENADLLKAILAGKQGPQRDIVLLNAAAALIAGDKAETLKQGVQMAAKSIDSGRALEKLQMLIEYTNRKVNIA